MVVNMHDGTGTVSILLALYIDGSNLYHSVKQRFGRTDLLFDKLCEKLVDGRRLVRNYYYYNAMVDQPGEQ